MHSGSNEQWSASRCTTTHTVKQRIHQNYSHLCQYIVTLLLCYDLWLITRWFHILDTQVFDSLDGKKIILVQKVSSHFISIFGFGLSILFIPFYHYVHRVEFICIFIIQRIITHHIFIRRFLYFQCFQRNIQGSILAS